MKLVPLTYNLRSLWKRPSTTLLTMSSIAATVALLAGVPALNRYTYTLLSNCDPTSHSRLVGE